MELISLKPTDGKGRNKKGKLLGIMFREQNIPVFSDKKKVKYSYHSMLTGQSRNLELYVSYHP